MLSLNNQIFLLKKKLNHTYYFTRYVEQLVASAEAAVEEVIKRGVSCVFFINIFLVYDIVNHVDMPP